MAWVFADDHDTSVTTDHLALVANWLNAGVNLHDVSFFRCPRTARDSSRPLLTVLKRLLVTVNDPTTGQIVWAEFNYDPILWEDSDVVLAHFSGNVSENQVSVCEFYPKHCIGQCLSDSTLDLNHAVFFGHKLFLIVVIALNNWSCVVEYSTQIGRAEAR